jgi:endogenous inhibitor of DNA gyrase (YacG/DUF329 family)
MDNDKKVMKECVCCSKEFEEQYPYQLYCSDRCEQIDQEY